MSQTFIKDGWTFDIHSRDLDLFTIPSETIFLSDQYCIRLVHIANASGLTRRVYFVDRKDKNAWVTEFQCQTEVEAKKHLENLTDTLKTPN